MVPHESCKWPSNSYGERYPLTRRLLLASVFSGVLPAQQKAEVIPLDLSLAGDLAVPNELFYIREHNPQPEGLTASAWKLTVAGRDFTVDDITTKPSKLLPVTLECAENPPGGGLVSHADWTGVPLADLLPPNAKAAAVRLTSADGFSRILPIAKALHPDTLIAYQMNGEKLPAAHGFPLRAIVPGWYGMDSVKWLRSIDLLEAAEPNRDYIRQEKSLFGTRATDPVTAIKIKSVFTRPQEAAILTKRRFTLRGLAWAGEDRVAKVEVSVDGAATWQPATLAPNQPKYTWAAWSFDWKFTRPGEYSLAVRATDEKGNLQPNQRPANRADAYEQNTWHSIKVTAQ